MFGKDCPFQISKKEKIHFPLSDHRALFFSLDIGMNKRGPGYWKFNKLLLNEPDFIEQIKDILSNSPELDNSQSKQMK